MSRLRVAVFGAAGAGLYAGNIYGSVKSIDAENLEMKKAFADKVKFAVEFRLP